MIFHVVSLPHTQTTKAYDHCAYTSKVRKFCMMMKARGHTVYLYASEENEAPCDELITIISKAEQAEIFGQYDHHQEFFKIEWDPNAKPWKLANERAIAGIKQRAGERDFICVIGGLCQKEIADAFPHMMTVEFGIGYTGVFSDYRVFESYAHMHYVSGLQHNDNGRFFDAVIPNYFEVDDFPFSEQKDDYFFFIGRMIPRKGVEIAVEVTRRIGAKLVLAGQGARQEGNTVSADGLELVGDHLEYVGYADVKKRGELMSKAKAVFVPTTYLEPFGGVSIEAMLCGTPVIATDFGAFPENVVDGLSGYRIRTIGEAVYAAENVQELQPQKIRDYAIKNFGLDRVGELYQAYFEQLTTLWEDGWYSDWQDGQKELHRYRRYL